MNNRHCFVKHVEDEDRDLVERLGETTIFPRRRARGERRTSERRSRSLAGLSSPALFGESVEYRAYPLIAHREGVGPCFVREHTHIHTAQGLVEQRERDGRVGYCGRMKSISSLECCQGLLAPSVLCVYTHAELRVGRSKTGTPQREERPGKPCF